MKKSFLMMMSVLFLTGCTFAQGDNFLEGMKKDFSGATSTIKGDMKTLSQQKLRGNDSPMSIQDMIDEVKAQKSKELEPINNQIANKEAQLRKTLLDTKLSISQKKAKTTLIQKEISTLKAQKNNIDEKYRQKMREFRYN